MTDFGDSHKGKSTVSTQFVGYPSPEGQGMLARGFSGRQEKARTRRVVSFGARTVKMIVVQPAAVDAESNTSGVQGFGQRRM